MKRSGDRSFTVSTIPKLDARRNDSKCTKTAMFYDLLLACRCLFYHFLFLF